MDQDQFGRGGVQGLRERRQADPDAGSEVPLVLGLLGGLGVLVVGGIMYASDSDDEPKPKASRKRR